MTRRAVPFFDSAEEAPNRGSARAGQQPQLARLCGSVSAAAYAEFAVEIGPMPLESVH